MLIYGGLLKVADFGLCCSGGGGSEEEAETTRGSLERVERVHGGTKGYMAPEQMLVRLQRKQRRAEKGSVEADEAESHCDMWAFGLLVGLMVGGEVAAAVSAYLQQVNAGWDKSVASGEAGGTPVTPSTMRHKAGQSRYWARVSVTGAGQPSRHALVQTGQRQVSGRAGQARGRRDRSGCQEGQVRGARRVVGVGSAGGRWGKAQG